jgi:hypothetical protein
MGNHLRIHNQSGFSIVATVMIMLILALFAAVAVSLVTTETGIGIQEERGVEAFYIADGGMQYTLKKNTFPNYAVSATTLGDGTFTVTVPTLTQDAASGAGTFYVSSTDGFIFNPGDSSNYWIMICGVSGNPTPNLTASSDCEKISCSGKTATTFTGCTGGRDSTAAIAHPGTTDHSVVMMYTREPDSGISTTLSQALPIGAKCKGSSSKICVASKSGFATQGFIRIYDATENYIEDIFYDGTGTGTTTCGCSGDCLGTNGCTRMAFDGGGNGTVSHSSGTQIWQSQFAALPTSKGVISGTVSILSGNVQRVLQSNVLPLQDP